MEFTLWGQAFYSGLRFDDVHIEGFSFLEYLPENKVLYSKQTEICGIPCRAEVYFSDNIIHHISISAITDKKEKKAPYHEKILKSLFGEPNARIKWANLAFVYPDFSAADYIDLEWDSSICIDFKRKGV